MNSELGLSIRKPKHLWKKSITVNFRDFSKALIKGIVDLSLGNWDSLAGDGTEALSALGLAANEAEIAWLMIYRSLLLAMKALIDEKTEYETGFFDGKSLQTQINQYLKTTSLVINEDFFNHPHKSSIAEGVKPFFNQWLHQTGLSKADAQSISDRLPIYFAAALNEEWNRHAQDYEILKERLDTPFTKANDRVQAWYNYSTWLQKQVEEPMFLEAFSLKQVYIPLRAYYSHIVNTQHGGDPDRVVADFIQSERIAVELEDELETWLSKAAKTDAIRLISGGPGSGKSSFAKMFAAKQAVKSSCSVLFIPLHHFETSIDLIDAVGNFILTTGILPYNPLAPEHRQGRLLIIFDGLDELAMQGKIAEQTSQAFIREVQRKVEMTNQRETCLQVLITGREMVVQANEIDFLMCGQVLHVLPYFIHEEDRNLYVGGEDLLKQDQRQIWWRFYGDVSGIGYKDVPASLANGNWIEITAQPLLNYLVAFSLKRGKLISSEETNRNAVYAELIQGIYDRGWTGRQHTALHGISRLTEFFLILELIALSIWHGNGRTTTVQDIESHCENPNLKKLLSRFQEGYKADSKANITRLMTAFYFRQSGHNPAGEKTFEFTHKSFGEYLAARRIVQEVKYIHRKQKDRQSSYYDDWDERCALYRWALVCGPSALDEYLFSFLLDEIRLEHQHNPNEVAAWQQTLCYLISFMLQNGMPMHKLDPRPDFQTENEQALNAEEALLAVLNCCARLTKRLSRIKEPYEGSLGGWISRMTKQRPGDTRRLARECLSFMDLSYCRLIGIDLISANLQHCSIEHANLSCSLLMGVKLQYAHISNSDFFGANISNADLQFAKIIKTNLKQAIIEGVNWEKTTINKVNLDEAIGNDLDITDDNHVIVDDEFKRHLQEALKACREISEVCTIAVSHAKDRLQCQVAFIYLLDKDGFITRSAINGIDKHGLAIEEDWLYDTTTEKAEHYSPDKGGFTGRRFTSTGEVEGYGYAQHSDNFEREYSKEGDYKYGKEYAHRLGKLLSGLSVKIAGSSRPYGALDVISKKDSGNMLIRFTKEDYYSLDSIARLVASHISRIRKRSRDRIMNILIEGLYSLYDSKMNVLHSICQDLADNLISDSFPFKVCIVRSYSNSGDFENIVKAPNAIIKGYGISWEGRSNGQPELDPAHITKAVINGKEPIYIRDLIGALESDQYKFHNPDWIIYNRLKALTIHPLISGREVVGTMSVYVGYIYEFSEEDKDFLTNVSRLLAFFVYQCNIKNDGK
jgi:GAF domain-containing protein